MLKLTLVTPNKKILTDAEVEEVFVPAFRGELNILPGHAALVTSLGSGILKYRLKGGLQLFAAAISWGYCEVFNDAVNVLADTAELPDEVNAEEAKLAIRETEVSLNSPDVTPESLDVLNKRLKLQQTRLQLLEEFPHGASESHTRQTAAH